MFFLLWKTLIFVFKCCLEFRKEIHWMVICVVNSFQLRIWSCVYNICFILYCFYLIQWFRGPRITNNLMKYFIGLNWIWDNNMSTVLEIYYLQLLTRRRGSEAITDVGVLQASAQHSTHFKRIHEWMNILLTYLRNRLEFMDKTTGIELVISEF